MAKILITRHGKSVKQGVWSGQIDADLSEEGRNQAKKLSKKLKDNFKIDLIVSSDLKRASKTARVISENLKCTFITFKEFREMDHGDVNGMTEEEFIQNFPEIIDAWKKNIDIRFPNGENMEDLEKRILPKFLDIINENQGKTILFVLHKAVILCLLGWFLKIPYTYRHLLKIDNCSITEIDFESENDYKIARINDTCHLR